jgi:hypothetical protein
MKADFPAPAAKIQEILPSQKLKVVQHVPGRTMVSILAMEYRRVEYMDPYNELAIAVPVQYVTGQDNQGLPGLFVLQLPVTTEQARWGGVEITGLPKFIADISFDDQGELCRSEARADGKKIITLECKRLSPELRSGDQYILSVKDNRLLGVLFHVEGQVGAGSAPGGASFRLGDHPIADALRTLEIDHTSAGHEYAPLLSATLNPPKGRFSLE